MRITSPPVKKGWVRWPRSEIIRIRQFSSHNGGTVTSLLSLTNLMARRASVLIKSSCLPGSGNLFLTWSRASFQFSPKPNSLEAFFISTRHHWYSFSAAVMSWPGGVIDHLIFEVG